MRDPIKLRNQIIGRRAPIGLVLGVHLFTERRPLGVINDRDVLGFLVLDNLSKHLSHAINSIRRLAFSGSKAASNRVVSAKNKRADVDQIERVVIQRTFCHSLPVITAGRLKLSPLEFDDFGVTHDIT